MKVRWADDSLRLRITPSELTALAIGDALTTTLSVPGGARWSVVVRPKAPFSELRSDDGPVEVRLTPDDLWRLVDGKVEGVYFTTGGDSPIRYFIEKDFPCGHPHAEEACEPETERFAPTERYLRRKRLAKAHRL